MWRVCLSRLIALQWVEVSCGETVSMVPVMPVWFVQVNAFIPEYWGGDIYHDVDKAFYKVKGWQPADTQQQHMFTIMHLEEQGVSCTGSLPVKALLSRHSTKRCVVTGVAPAGVW